MTCRTPRTTCEPPQSVTNIPSCRVASHRAASWRVGPGRIVSSHVRLLCSRASPACNTHPECACGGSMTLGQCVYACPPPPRRKPMTMFRGKYFHNESRSQRWRRRRRRRRPSQPLVLRADNFMLLPFTPCVCVLHSQAHLVPPVISILFFSRPQHVLYLL